MTIASTVDRARLASLMAAETATFERANPRSRALFERAKGSLLDGVPMNWMIRWAGPFPLFVESASGARFTRRRRPRVRRLLPRRHGRDGRPRTLAHDRGGRAPAAPRDHPHAARPRTRSSPPTSCGGGSASDGGSSRSRPRTPTGSRSASPATSRAGRRSSSTTTTTTARSTRRSRGSRPDGGVVARRGNLGAPVPRRRRRGSWRSTTSTPSSASSPTATSRSRSSSRR